MSPGIIAASILALAAACVAAAASAQEQTSEPGADTAIPAPLNTVTILGTQDGRSEIAGSAHFIGPDDLKKFRYADVLKILRTTPGVYVQEEEGFGLRPNIGLRGSGLDRSARIALLEDGVLIAPAPYSAPAAYYFPTARRLQGVEVLKGPSSIAVGPRTTGGAVNLLSTSIPYGSRGVIDTLAGKNGYFDTHAFYGDSTDRMGWLVETVQQYHDGFKDLDSNSVSSDTGYDLHDYRLRFRLNSAIDSAYQQGLEFKLGFTEQEGNETYLGLTGDDFRATPMRRYAGSQRDLFQSEHNQYGVTYTLTPLVGSWDFSTTWYYNDFSRNWYKLQSVDGTGISSVLQDPMTYVTELDYLRGADSPDDALVLRNNNREYYSSGIQSEFNYLFSTGATDVLLTTGFRYHRDEEDRFQDEDGYRMENGDLIMTSDGAPGSQANRVSDAKAIALYVATEINRGNWSVTPGVRFEHIELRRFDYSTTDPLRTMGPSQIRVNDINEIIPGLGVIYHLSNSLSLLGSVYKGFNPPAPGSDSDSEESINYELGGRFNNGQTAAELIIFYNDYDNLVGTVTASTGGGMIGDQFDAGRVTVSGLELYLGTSFDEIGGSHLVVPVDFSYTYTHDAEFRNSFESDYDPWGDVMAGDELPYIPEHQFRLTTGLAGDRWAATINATFVDEIRTLAGAGAIPPDQAIDAHTVVDIAASFEATRRLDLFVRLDNVFDEVYAVARRPAGLRPGKDRTAVVGLRFEL